MCWLYLQARDATIQGLENDLKELAAHVKLCKTDMETILRQNEKNAHLQQDVEAAQARLIQSLRIQAKACNYLPDTT